MNEFIKNKLE